MRVTHSTQDGNFTSFQVESGFSTRSFPDKRSGIAVVPSEISASANTSTHRKYCQQLHAMDARTLYFSLLDLDQFSDDPDFASVLNVDKTDHHAISGIDRRNSIQMRAAAAQFVRDRLKQIQETSTRSDNGSGLSLSSDELSSDKMSSDALPPEVTALSHWIEQGVESVGQQYRHYVEQRQSGAQRRYFPTRSHALNFLNAVAPTKLVDGAWLYGLTKYWNDPRLRPLIRIYLEELGDGDAALNHVAMYRKLLEQEDCDSPGLLTEDHYVQGALQLALACNAEEFLPEIIGFNLGYEQLPLHLLITAYELRELGIDPYYFTLHVTIDNSHTGHAHKALQGLLNILPHGSDSDAFMRRVRQGAALNNCGVGSTEIIKSFDLQQTVLKILAAKSQAGKYLHGDYCRVGGRTVSDWLQHAENMPQFLLALEKTGWIKRGQPAEQSRFWQLLDGNKAKMFGVFTAFEMQVIRDWIEGAAAVPIRRPAQQHPTAKSWIDKQGAAGIQLSGAEPLSDLSGDLASLCRSLAAVNNITATMRLLQPWLAPNRHHTPSGLFATRKFSQLLG